MHHISNFLNLFSDKIKVQNYLNDTFYREEFNNIKIDFLNGYKS